MPRDRAPNSTTDTANSSPAAPSAVDSKKLVCGLVMPLANTDNCPPQHWAEVRSIIQEAIESISEYEFECDMVSNANESAVIQASIVRNLNTNDIVVCDVSGRNPNVMFELGMRVAFDKPVVLIKDDQTDFSFDIGPIAHLIYRRDLRYNDVQKFKTELASKVVATYKKAAEGGDESSYLSSFGPIKVAQLKTQEVSLGELMLERLDNVQQQVKKIAAAAAWAPWSSEHGRSNMLADSWREFTTDPDLYKKGDDIGITKAMRLRLRHAIAEQGLAPIGSAPANLDLIDKLVKEHIPSLNDAQVRAITLKVLGPVG
ncbi:MULTISPECIES: hypothetical protein [Achromobacter]|uniref:RNA helicase n=1 Tax=Achromobacter ruhlandii TaxID=72557 RepID=A0A6S7EC14_9BURK|nr:hypothetical protein [Achromobacter ruhlandii]CAB3903697.1 hypothetical protein LMG3328_04429 [Achromobacter ruhlandii]